MSLGRCTGSTGDGANDNTCDVAEIMLGENRRAAHLNTRNRPNSYVLKDMANLTSNPGNDIEVLSR